MYEIKLLNKIVPVGVEVFNNGNYTVSDSVEHPAGILVRSASLHDMPFNKELLAIARAGAGVNNIPIDRCSENGIVVFNTPGANANAVKELALASLLLASRDIVGGIEWAKSLQGTPDLGKAVEKGKSQFAGPEIEGKKLGIIGLGAIGVMVANTAHHLGMEVYGYDPYISVDAAWGLSRFVKKADSLKDIYENCDYITIHVALTPATKNYINSEALDSMKHGVRIINLSRGEVVNNEDMKEALRSGKVAKHITDFPSEETLSMPNTICIPHLGASTPESESNCAVMAAKELKNYIEKGSIRNSVNFPDVDIPREGATRVCVIHENIPSMLSVLSTAFSNANINIDNMISKSKKDMAYTIFDANDNLPDAVVQSVLAVPGIIRLRVIH